MDVNTKLILDCAKELMCKTCQLIFEHFWNNVISWHHFFELSTTILYDSLDTHHVVEEILIEKEDAVSEFLGNVFYLVKLLDILIDENKYLIGSDFDVYPFGNESG